MVIQQKYSLYEEGANCAVKDVKTVLLKLLFPLQTSAIGAINNLCLMNYSNTAKIRYTLIKYKLCC